MLRALLACMALFAFRCNLDLIRRFVNAILSNRVRCGQPIYISLGAVHPTAEPRSVCEDGRGKGQLDPVSLSLYALWLLGLLALPNLALAESSSL